MTLKGIRNHYNAKLIIVIIHQKNRKMQSHFYYFCELVLLGA